jgi:hypothetical protein
MCANSKLSQRRGSPHLTVPNFVPTQARHSSEHCAFRWVYISGRNPNIAVASYSRKRPCIAARFAQAGQEAVSQGIEHKFAEWLLIVLLGENRQSLEYLFVLPLET